MKASPRHREFEKAIRAISRRWHVWQVFSDFCEMAAIAISNALRMDDELERRYMDIVGRYNHEEAAGLAQLLGIVTMALDDEPQDFLGEMFMKMELSDHWRGQFFTPYDLCRMMASLLIDDATIAKLGGGGFVTMNEPSCGAGAMVIAKAQALLDRGVNYQQALHVTAVDVDPTAAHMTYIQLSLLHVPAYVVIGNTLTLEERRVFVTPAHVMGLWDFKLRATDVGEAVADKPVPEVAPMETLDMFGFEQAGAEVSR